MGREQPADPSRRGAAFSELDIQFDQHVEIVLVAAEHRRLDDVEIADVAERRDVLFRNAPGLFRGVGARLDLRRDLRDAAPQLGNIGAKRGCAGTSFNWATGTIGLLRVFDG